VITVTVPKNAALAALLRGSGGACEPQLNELAAAADPSSGSASRARFEDAPPPPLLIHAGHAATKAEVAEDVTALLHRARAEGNPAATLLEPILRQLGAPVPAT
jgi:hypothetical protein